MKESEVKSFDRILLYKMHDFLFSLIVLSFSAAILTARDPHRLTAVSNATIAEALYRRIRQGSTDTEVPPAIDRDTKNRICYHISSSTYSMHVSQDKPVFIHEVYKNLLFKNPKLFLSLYDLSPGADLIYANRTKPVDVYVGEEDENTLRDYTFTCLTMNAEADEDEEDELDIEVYLVSKEYNLSDDPTESEVAGRFLFFYLKTVPGRLELFSVAEEPAESLSNPGEDVERLYLESIKEETVTDSDHKGPICYLTDDERLRICTIVLSSSSFERELKFVPRYEYIDDDDDCFKHRIYFQDDQIKLETVGKVYEEWMIRCIPEHRYATFQAEYFLSEVHNSDDKVFLYRWDEESKLVIENQFGNVRFEI